MSAPTPVSTARIEKVLSGWDLNFGSTDNAELVVPTGNAVLFINATNPQILQMRAQWRGVATDGPSFAALAEQVGQCNSTRTGPKAYLAPFEDGESFSIIAEANILTSVGLTKPQLNAFLETSMSLIFSFFADLELACPNLVTWATEENE